MRSGLIAAAALLAACTQPSQSGPDTVSAPAVDPAVAAVVMSAMPGVEITGGEADGQGEYEVTGTLDGQEYEFDLLGPEGGWRVVEIQRDIAWGDAPEAVRAAAAGAPNAFEPARVIESRQPADGSIVYELFAPGAAAGAPTLEVRFMDGEAAIMPTAH
jgi:hypothetical protein